MPVYNDLDIIFIGKYFYTSMSPFFKFIYSIKFVDTCMNSEL